MMTPEDRAELRREVEEIWEDETFPAKVGRLVAIVEELLSEIDRLERPMVNAGTFQWACRDCDRRGVGIVEQGDHCKASVNGHPLGHRVALVDTGNPE